MKARAAQAFCSQLPGATCAYPFGPDVRVYKVCNKLFALMPEAAPWSISLKCDPVLARILRANHPAITPGYHLNKVHWNTVTLDGSVPPALVREMIVNSYELVVSKLNAAERSALASLAPDGRCKGCRYP